jgi:hypothetical protein
MGNYLTALWSPKETRAAHCVKRCQARRALRFGLSSDESDARRAYLQHKNTQRIPSLHTADL